MTTDQFLVFTIGMVLVAVSVAEFWRPQLKASI